MRKILLAATLMLVPAWLSTGKALAQTVTQCGTEVCVNASNVEDAKRLFPNARLHIVPDVPGASGFRIVSGYVHTDGNGEGVSSSDSCSLGTALNELLQVLWR